MIPYGCTAIFGLVPIVEFLAVICIGDHGSNQMKAVPGPRVSTAGSVSPSACSRERVLGLDLNVLNEV
jgi:hypothetical protein